uniref:Tubulin--tyrosine ligase-like protein 12 n=1 Tax=Panthera tigris altaica TaxID=74533 RepID=A0A8C9KFI2_PANTA
MLDVSSSTPEPPDQHYQAILEENKEKLPLAISPVAYPRDHVFRVYTDVQQVLGHLTHPRFTFTQSEADADILYNFSHFKDYSPPPTCTRPHRPPGPRLGLALTVASVPQPAVTAGGVLHAPAERVPPCSLRSGPPRPLCDTCHCSLREVGRPFPRAATVLGRRCLGRWARRAAQPTPYALRGQDNHWICKPWNLARSLDTHITRSLHSVIRHRESTPKVVSKYIESPVLFLREDVGKVKFDVRYVVLLRSVKPLTLFVYDVFWLRFSNRSLCLSQVHYDEFIPEFEKQYPEFLWKRVEGEIFQAFTELFQAACAKPPPLGLCDYASSRAVYAIDLMLKWDDRPDGRRVIQPQILEVNFNPDCERACRYHPTFFNDVFSTLYLDEPSNCHVSRLV